MKFINYFKLKRKIFQRLKKELSKDLLYHNIQHTKEVLKSAIKLAKLEKISKDEKYLLKTACILHDIGYLERYEDNEVIAVKIAKQILPEFNYNSEEIKTISQIIMATKMPQIPKDNLSKIICDADLDNLGKKNFFIKSNLLRFELEKQGKILPLKEFYQNQINLLKSHKYFTNSANKLYGKQKEKNLQELKERLKKE